MDGFRSSGGMSIKSPQKKMRGIKKIRWWFGLQIPGNGFVDAQGAVKHSLSHCHNQCDLLVNKQSSIGICGRDSVKQSSPLDLHNRSGIQLVRHTGGRVYHTHTRARALDDYQAIVSH